MHTLLDLRGNIPSFIHISDGKLHDVHALDLLLPEAGAIYVMDRGYVDFGRLHGLHLAGAFFVTRAKSNTDAHRVYSAPADRERASSAIRPSHSAVITPPRAIQSICAGYASAIPKPPRHSFSSPTSRLASRDRLRPLQEPLAGRAFL